jgi:cytochrome d ubiquinol oxidase subunit II
MELFWYTVLIVFFAMYMVLDGYDFGAGIIHLFFAKSEQDKKVIVRSIGPFWDANEVWLIAGGGILFFAFPTLYASSLSGFYLPLMMILWLLIFRGIGIELRGQINHTMWHAIWDKAFGVASLLLTLFFGIAMGNIVRGVNLGGVVDGVSIYEPQYFFLPLWGPTFDPLSENLGVIDWFTLMIGVIGVIAITIHGATWIIFKTKSSINASLKVWVFRLSILLIVLIVVSLFSLQFIKAEPFHNYLSHLGLWIFPILMTIGLIGLLGIRKFNNDITGFVFSSLFLLGSFASTAAAIFPNLLPSSNAINPSLTLYNTAASNYGLSIGQNWFIGGAILIIIYIIIQYRIFKGKMDDVEYGEH